MNSKNFRLGCAIWAYKDWVGDLFPAGSRSSDFLSLYSHRFSTVEGNTTFYSVPDSKMVKRWATETPSDFEFCLKLPKTITHQGLLLPQAAGAIAFLHQMRDLGDRLGVTFAQLPPSYSPAQFDDLIAFLEVLKQEGEPLAVEVRHPKWFEEPHASQLHDALKSLGVGKVLLDSRPIYECDDDPQLESERRKPKLPVQPVLTTNFTLIRYISHPTLQLNEAWMREWVTQIDRWLRQGVRVYFFVHCPVEARSPANARHFQTLLEKATIPVPPLPWNEIELDGGQLSLF